MKKNNLENYPRKELFEAFKDHEVPFFSVTNLVEISQFKSFIEQNGYGFFTAMSFLISKAVNRVPELRHRLINGEIFEFESVDPGYTVLLDDRTFSFCDSRHFEGFEAYRQNAEQQINAVRARPDRGTGEKHQMFFISNLPWFSFSSITHPYSKQYASIPIISIGKYFEQQTSLMMPVGIQVNHALVDGIHVGEFYELFSRMCQNPVEYWQ